MSTAAEPQNARDLALATALVERITTDLAMICDRAFVVESVVAERATAKTPAVGGVHISFKLEVRSDGKGYAGALTVPLPEAIALASWLMMLPDETVAKNRELADLDRSLKDALIEIGNLIAGAADAVVRDRSGGRLSACAKGCQGIRAGQNPAFEYASGEPLLVVRARGRLHEFPAFELVLQAPAGVLVAPA